MKIFSLMTDICGAVDVELFNTIEEIQAQITSMGLDDSEELEEFMNDLSNNNSCHSYDDQNDDIKIMVTQHWIKTTLKRKG